MPTDPMQIPLRDVHFPEAISWWPLAFGWWILVCLLIIFIVTGWLWYQRRQQKKYSALTLAKEELFLVQKNYVEHNDPKRLIIDLSVLIRRLSISIFPRVEAAGLTGEKWLDFLDDAMANNPFSTGAGRILMDGPYRPNVMPEEIEPLVKICDEWIDAVNTQSQGKAP